MAKTAPCATDTAINQIDYNTPITRIDIAAIIEVVRMLLPLQQNQEITHSLPSNQLARQNTHNRLHNGTLLPLNLAQQI